MSHLKVVDKNFDYDKHRLGEALDLYKRDAQEMGATCSIVTHEQLMEMDGSKNGAVRQYQKYHSGI